MPVNLFSDHLLTLQGAAKELPRLSRGRKVHLSTLYRWVRRGVGGVKLEAVKVGRGLVTSREALQRFAERRSGHEASGSSPASERARLSSPEHYRCWYHSIIWSSAGPYYCCCCRQGDDNQRNWYATTSGRAAQLIRSRRMGRRVLADFLVFRPGHFSASRSPEQY